ncbi:MAG: hypothetical protein AAF433_19870 [Bacteroidota bacterium]
MPSIYRAPTVVAVQNLFAELLQQPLAGAGILDYLQRMVARVELATKQRASAVYSLFSNYHPSFLGASSESLNKIDFSLADCRLLIAQERGFENWEEVMALADRHFDPDFEQALQFLLAGDQKALGQLLSEKPDLVRDRSPYPHDATLLHYCGSNGVEMWRQQVPDNLADLIKLLLDKGADPQAKMQVYGGAFTTAELLDTSAHPRDAGNWAAAMAALDKT